LRDSVDGFVGIGFDPAVGSHAHAVINLGDAPGDHFGGTIEQERTN
jgi:hypothetical protein